MWTKPWLLRSGTGGTGDRPPVGPVRPDAVLPMLVGLRDLQEMGGRPR